MNAVVVAAPVASVLVAGTAVVLASGLAGAAVILDIDLRRPLRRRRTWQVVERERDVAAGLGVRWPRWVLLRLSTVGVALLIGAATGVWALALFVSVVALFGLRFALAGRAAKQRLQMERAFLTELRRIRDRMAVGNQSLDTALQEVGRSPENELQYVMAPLATRGSIVESIAECAIRSRSPIVEQACGVLIWARTRSLDALISTIDDVLVPVGEAQLDIQEEALVTLAQQRAVTFAMAALMAFMFATVIRVDAFRSFYQSGPGVAVLLAAGGIFFVLVAALGRIVAVPTWTRWDMRRIAELEVTPRA